MGDSFFDNGLWSDLGKNPMGYQVPEVVVQRAAYQCFLV
jgi:hypothetical protein